MTAVAENRFAASKEKSAALSIEADAEASQSANLENKRKAEEKMLTAKNMSLLAKNNKIVISGKNGEDLLNFFKETTDLVNQNE